jgi:hypothetical protein
MAYYLLLKESIAESLSPAQDDRSWGSIFGFAGYP